MQCTYQRRPETGFVLAQRTHQSGYEMQMQMYSVFHVHAKRGTELFSKEILQQSQWRKNYKYFNQVKQKYVIVIIFLLEIA